MATWPTDTIVTTHTDAGTDDPSQARAEINKTLQAVKDIIGCRAAVNGIPSLDGSTLIPSAQLPVVPITKGGTGAVTAALARVALDAQQDLGFTPADIAGDTFTGDVTLGSSALKVLYFDRLDPGLPLPTTTNYMAFRANDTASATRTMSFLAAVLTDQAPATFTSHFILGAVDNAVHGYSCKFFYDHIDLVSGATGAGAGALSLGGVEVIDSSRNFFGADLTITGTPTLPGLTDGSNADALHGHSKLVAPDGSPDPAFSIDASGKATGVGIVEAASFFGPLYSAAGDVSFRAGSGGDLRLDVGGLLKVQDRDGGFALRFSIDSANGNWESAGNGIVGGTLTVNQGGNSSVYIGQDDTHRGLLYLYGDGSTRGGTLLLYNGADEDSVVSHYVFEPDGTTLNFGPDTDTDLYQFGHLGLYIDGTLGVCGAAQFDDLVTIASPNGGLIIIPPAVTGIEDVSVRNCGITSAQLTGNAAFNTSYTAIQNTTLSDASVAYVSVQGSLKAGDVIEGFWFTSNEIGDAPGDGTVTVELLCHLDATDSDGAATSLGSASHNQVGGGGSKTKVTTIATTGSPHTVVDGDAFVFKVTLDNQYNSAGGVILFNLGLALSTRQY